jgi:hypothetical protein
MSFQNNNRIIAVAAVTSVVGLMMMMLSSFVSVLQPQEASAEPADLRFNLHFHYNDNNGNGDGNCSQQLTFPQLEGDAHNDKTDCSSG